MMLQRTFVEETETFSFLEHCKLTKTRDATQSLHLETANWWYDFAECSII